MTGFRRARALAPLLATALVALLALAGPATANSGSHGSGDDDGPTGTIASYDSESGVLTIDLSDGGSVSGLVTSRTWIDAGDKNCGDDDGGDASRKAKAARNGGKVARHGDWGCHERRNGRHGHGEGRGWHHGWSHNHGDESDLVTGAVVEDAILILKDGKAFYAKVDLD
jgi:hypothetical protein